MPYRIDEDLKARVVENMVKNLTVLRTMLHLSQAELAELIGMGRQNFAAIENRKRKMTWNTFLSLLFVFSQNRETSGLLEIFGVYPQELRDVYSDKDT